MKCPHCLVAFHDQPITTPLSKDIDGWWGIVSLDCPNCKRSIFKLAKGDLVVDDYNGTPRLVNPRDEILIRPKASIRDPVPKQVPEEFAEDYNEACLVLADSPKASAALSRRCLQHILREKAGVKHTDLYKEIQEVLNSNTLPSDIAQSIDLIRNIGNFAAHPNKSQRTGEIVPVEPEEAEWCLDVIEMLFDFYFVRPEINQRKIKAIDQKLADTGKQQLKPHQKTTS